MKKNLIIGVIVLIVCVMGVMAFTSCNIKLSDMDGTENYDSTEKARSVELVNDLFEEMLNDPDFVVTCTNKDNELQYTETVKGADCYTLDKDGAETYAFKKGKVFYVATISKNANGEEQRAYYCSDSTKSSYYAGNEADAMEKMYKDNYCSFMNDLIGAGVVNDLSEEGATFHCIKHVERESGYATSSLDFTYVSEGCTVTITASAEEDLVKTLCVVITDATENGRSSDLTWTFTYGSASVTLPDLGNWNK